MQWAATFAGCLLWVQQLLICVFALVLIVQTFKLPWYLVAKGQVAWKQLWKSSPTPVQPRPGRQTDAAAAAGVKVGMLRVVNAHDIVPDTPITLPLPPFL